MKKYKLEITAFLCGGIQMLIELVAARILSPYVGSSNLIWTTIIGVMLVSMSLGYWLGGKLADKKPNINILSLLLIFAAISVSLIPILEVNFVSQLALLIDKLEIVAFICSAIVFGIPSFIMATASPYVVKLKDVEKTDIGKLSGKISSISTIGSIVGTFTGGFLLIPYLGVRTIILAITILVLILAAILYKDKNKKFILILIFITIIAFSLQYLGAKMFRFYNPDIIEDLDSEYSRIWVKEIDTGEISYKTLLVDTALESYINKETNEMGGKYLKYYDLFNYFNEDSKNVLIIGGAAYTYPMHYLQTYEDKNMDVVEIDKKMTEIAEKQFGLDSNNPRLGIYHQDGRSFLNKTENKYDAIIMDAFKGANAPFELATYEAMKQAYNCLNENGVVITNIVSSLEGDKSDFIKYEYSTYKEVFDDVKLFRVNDTDNNTIQNLILVGIKGNINTDSSVEYENLLKNEIRDFISEYKIVTDNFCPIGS